MPNKAESENAKMAYQGKSLLAIIIVGKLATIIKGTTKVKIIFTTPE